MGRTSPLENILTAFTNSTVKNIAEELSVLNCIVSSKWNSRNMALNIS